jgi:FMN phosphatase YigB (HAD superfamily)
MKPILFLDFDGTLCFDRYWRSLPAEQYEQVQNLIFGNDRSMLKDWMIGKFTAEEINAHIASSTGIEYEYLWKIFVRDCETMTIAMDLLDTIDKLRATYVVILITTNMDSFTRFTVPALKLDRHFDYINNSALDRTQKYENGGELFAKIAERLGTVLQKCILIDDNAKNCELFEARGGTAYQIVPERGVIYYLEKLKK